MKAQLLLSVKRLMSYFFDISIDRASTPLNPELELSLRQGRFYLSTPNAVYSHGDLYSNFFEAFQKINFQKHHYKEVLILGFGMASIPYMLERNFGQQFNYKGIESDNAIVIWAKEYALPQIKSPITLLNTDAFEFVKNTEKTYDLICMDVFVDDKVPGQFLSPEFTDKLPGMLKPDGLLMWNHLIDGNHEQNSTASFFHNVFRITFPDSEILELGANWMLLNRSITDV